MSEEVKDQEVKACEACAGEAAADKNTDDAAVAAAKKKNGMIVRIVVWAIVVIGLVFFFIYKNDIVEYMRRGKIIKQITQTCSTEVGFAPFSVKYIGDNKYEVIFEDPAKVQPVMKMNNKITYIYKPVTEELELSDNDAATMQVRKTLYINKNSKKNAPEAPKK